jgi:hypothetical protein
MCRRPNRYILWQEMESLVGMASLVHDRGAIQVTEGWVIPIVERSWSFQAKEFNLNREPTQTRCVCLTCKERLAAGTIPVWRLEGEKLTCRRTRWRVDNVEVACCVHRVWVASYHTSWRVHHAQVTSRRVGWRVHRVRITTSCIGTCIHNPRITSRRVGWCDHRAPVVCCACWPVNRCEATILNHLQLSLFNLRLLWIDLRKRGTPGFSTRSGSLEG